MGGVSVRRVFVLYRGAARCGVPVFGITVTTGKGEAPVFGVTTGKGGLGVSLCIARVNGTGARQSGQQFCSNSVKQL